MGIYGVLRRRRPIHVDSGDMDELATHSESDIFDGLRQQQQQQVMSK